MNEIATQSVLDITGDSIVKDAKNLLGEISFIAKELGIRDMGKFEVLRISEITIKYFKHLTVQDIRLAFEWYAAGYISTKIKSHYGQFSTIFYMDVIREYQTLKGKIILHERAKNTKKLPQNTDEKQKNREEFLKGISDSFEKYEKNGTIPRLWLNWPVYRYLSEEKGLISGDITEEDRKLAKEDIFEEIVENEFKFFDYKEHEGRSIQKSHQRVVLEYYDQLIKNKDHIKNHF